MPFTNDQLTTFTRALAVDRGHLGLIVTTGDPGALALAAPANAAEVIAVRVETDPESILDRFVACARESRWCRLHLLDGTLPSRVYNQLRSLTTTGHCEDRSGADVRWPGTAKLVVIIAHDALGRITIPTFLDLFGPMLREE